MPYHVYLCDITNRIGSDARRIEVKAILKAYFDPIVKKAGIEDGVTVSFVTDNPQPDDIELLAYYSSSGWHVVTAIEGTEVTADAEGGLTLDNGKVTGSDVVADEDHETRRIANLTFHELMHNKLGKGDEMHTMGGLAGGTVNASMRPSQANTNQMAAALKTKRPQWTGGFALLKNRHEKVSI